MEHLHIASLSGVVSDLTAFTTDPSQLETILSQTEPLGFRVTIEFSRSGAIALMPLALPIQVEFLAKAVGSGSKLELGKTSITTAAHQLIYHPTLLLPNGVSSASLLPEEIYEITAVLRVGAPAYPAFITGIIKGLMIQIYAEPEEGKA
jgi:hypothetical protein